MVVVIDDQPDIRELLSMHIEQEMQLSVSSFDTVKLSYQYICDHHDSIKIVVSDYNLKNETGLDLFEQIHCLNIPFILLTGEQLRPNVLPDEFVNSNKNQLLVKPVDPVEIVRVIKLLIK